jgi:hypothetical protein
MCPLSYEQLLFIYRLKQYTLFIKWRNWNCPLLTVIFLYRFKLYAFLIKCEKWCCPLLTRICIYRCPLRQVWFDCTSFKISNSFFGMIPLIGLTLYQARTWIKPSSLAKCCNLHPTFCHPEQWREIKIKVT